MELRTITRPVHELYDFFIPYGSIPIEACIDHDKAFDEMVKLLVME